MATVFTTAYCPPIEYIAAIADGMTLSRDEVIPSIIYIEDSENYQKQSWRNRCAIYSANGVEYLNFPIVHEKGRKIPIREVQIDYSTDWVTLHKRAIASAYGTSAFFEYYKDDFFAILDSHPATLFEMNLSLLKFFLDKIGIAAEINFTGVYRSSYDIEDLREVIHPKRPDDILQRLHLDKEYYQVFGPQYGFQPNLSIMDLLFNLGPESIIFLKKFS